MHISVKKITCAVILLMLPIFVFASKNEDGSATHYCLSVGGQVQHFILAYIDFDGHTITTDTKITMCHFPQVELGKARVEINTLAAEKPNLVYNAVKYPLSMPSSGGQKNPAAEFCVKSGGNVSAYANYYPYAQSIGWLNEADKSGGYYDMCVMGDGSIINQWTLTFLNDKNHPQWRKNLIEKFKASKSLNHSINSRQNF